MKTLSLIKMIIKKTKAKYYCNAISKEFKKKKHESVRKNLKLWSE